MAAFPSQQDYLSDQSDEIFNSFSFPVGDPSSEFFNVASSAEGVQPPLSFNFSPSPLLSASSTPTTCTVHGFNFYSFRSGLPSRTDNARIPMAVFQREWPLDSRATLSAIPNDQPAREHTLVGT
ncbi:hypothetical protein, variant [Puccinia striiformis f. sp. tritici PST-78]|nr:hypothetical protein, variant [Puccinia striiformis f. sp. tritici PST-78]